MRDTGKEMDDRTSESINQEASDIYIQWMGVSTYKDSNAQGLKNFDVASTKTVIEELVQFHKQKWFKSMCSRQTEQGREDGWME